MIDQYYGDNPRVHTYQVRVKGTTYLYFDAQSMSEAYDKALDSLDRLNPDNIDFEIDEIEKLE